VRPTGAIVKDYVDISKPRIILLLLVVAWAAMAVARGGLPDGRTFLWVTIAGTASTAASGALNHVIERKKDSRMGRTADRPVASGRIHPAAASTYAAILTAIAFLSLWLPGLYLAAWLTLGAVAFYIIIYTWALKPTTPQNIVIGGFAGSFPALIGWSAATGTLGAPAWLLAAIVFFWTPPHFWALALLYKEDYAAAEYPMMPTIKGDESTKKQMIAYAALGVLSSLMLVVIGAGGYLFLVAALLLGYRFVFDAVKLLGHDDRKAYRRYFLWTIQYLGYLLLALIADTVLVSYFPGAAPPALL
jgi:protoheme IX farnesyltransferase